MYEFWTNPESSTCDFCLRDILWPPLADSTPVVKQYRAEATTVVRLPTDQIWVDEGTWIACESCAKMIDAGRWSQLIERCVTSHFEVLPELRSLPQNAVTRAMVASRLRIGLRAVFGNSL